MVPWKLILFFIFLLIFVLFAGFNIRNTSDISLGFKTLNDVPIFVSLFIAFLLGGFVVMPFIFIGRRKKIQKVKKKIQSGAQEKPSIESEPVIPAQEDSDNIGDEPE